VRQEVFEGETHNSVYPLIIAKGLPFVLPSETAELVAIAVKPAVLDRYVGTYRISPAQTLVISRQGDKLFARVNQDLVALEAETESRFFSREANAILTFQPGDKAPGLVLRVRGADQTGPRVE
jgi:hypothetical protein